ncbi:hypothetical protein Y032_0204g1884 [Ancylostoma ceylanicum]|nr:hypothetical protein Y032_0204g1884 [Ancylostoma ceylanicum]
MNAKPSETKLPKPSFASCVSQSYVVYGTTNHASHRWFPWRKYWCADDAYSQLQMSADKSWGRVAGLSLSAAWIQRGMQGRDAEENRAAVLTLVCGHLELTIWVSLDRYFSGRIRIEYKNAERFPISSNPTEDCRVPMRRSRVIVLDKYPAIRNMNEIQQYALNGSYSQAR